MLVPAHVGVEAVRDLWQKKWDANEKADTASTFRNQFTKETEEVTVSKTQTYMIKILKPLFNGKVCLSDKFDVC